MNTQESPVREDEHGAAVATADAPRLHDSQSPGPAPRRFLSGFVFLLLVCAVAGGIYSYAIHGGKKSDETRHAVESHNPVIGSMSVQVTHPTQGGIARTSDQAGSVHAFEHADLYAKVSGYLKVQNVDIGDTVKVNQVLAEIDDPEIFKAVDQARAVVDQAQAKVKIADARIKAAEADVRASQALVVQSKVGVTTQEANVRLRTKQLKRIQGLVERKAVEDKLEDEEQDKFEAAKSAEQFARASVLTSEAQEASKLADVEQARADLAEAKANVEVAQANLGKAQVLAGYTKILSPYDGVVTLRTYHPGDFVRSAAEGGAVPILAVARVDKMRVVLPVPDVDVPFVNRGDPVVFRIVALPGEEFKGA